MIADLGFIIACCAFMISAILLMVCKNIIDVQQEVLKKIQSRMYYLEMVLSYHDLAPLPWEMDDFDIDDEREKTRTFERADNVVYLTREKE